MKRKKLTFQVLFELDSLTSVPFMTGVLFAKIKLLDGGKFKTLSSRQTIVDHVVTWQQKPCLLRISINQERKGGKTFERLGYVEINLAEFAGSEQFQQKYILQGHSGRKERQDNSLLHVNGRLTLKDGDPSHIPPETKPTVYGIADDPSTRLEPEHDFRDEAGNMATTTVHMTDLGLGDERRLRLWTPLESQTPDYLLKTRAPADELVDKLFSQVAMSKAL